MRAKSIGALSRSRTPVAGVMDLSANARKTTVQIDSNLDVRPDSANWGQLGRNGLVGDGLDRLLLTRKAVLAGAHHTEGARAERAVRPDRKALDGLPPQALDLEWVHLDRDRRPLARDVVVIDRL